MFPNISPSSGIQEIQRKVRLAEELAVYQAEAEDPGDDAPATSGGEARA